ncbi:MAG TPA: putative sulfate exporter family transporter, partial [Fimbriimonadaceae bacterium]|nr:putative sulfate exporter family transporter [Fimbriimonadaceae bacterium]
MLLRLLPGLLLCVALAAAAIALARWTPLGSTLHLGPLLLVILLAMVVAGFLPPSGLLEPGVKFCQRDVLRLAVAGLGFRLSLS